MAKRSQCEFSLIRYVPDPVKNEFVNIGVLLRSRGDRREAAVRFTRDWSRVRCMDPEVDIAMLEALEGEVQRRLSDGGEEGPPVIGVLEDSFSNAVQVTEAKACLAESFAAEMDGLMRLYVEAQRRKRETRSTGRQAIHARMRTRFEQAGVWALMQKRINAAKYTQAGDTLKIDCGYRPNGMIRMFQAVTLGGDAEAAKVLAFSQAELAAGVLRVERAELELTAIVEPLREIAGEEADAVEQYRFGVETMERHRIRVLTTTDLERVAQTARRELRV